MDEDVLQKYFRNELTPSVAVMKLLLELRDYDAALAQLSALNDARVEPLLRMMKEHERGCRQAVAIMKKSDE